MPKEPPRFEVIHSESNIRTSTKILRDRETGVCYLVHENNSTGLAMTPLLNAVGGVVITGLPERR
nr:hypothetical protein [Propionibacterium sp.]